jgi:hypothetical protein
MATTDEDLSQLEKDIRVLKIEYEQYFAGGRKRLPADTQWRVETMIKRYGDRSTELNFGQRFRYSNLSQTYAKYQEIWRKRLQQKEAGKKQRHFGAAAKAIEEARSRAEAEGAEFIAVVKDPAQEVARVEELFQRLLKARKNLGEAGPEPALAEFKRFVQKKTDELKQKKGCEKVEYIVSVVAGRVKLRARVV